MKNNILFFCATSLFVVYTAQAAPKFEPLPQQAAQIRHSIQNSSEIHKVLLGESTQTERELHSLENELGALEEQRRQMSQTLSEKKISFVALEKKLKQAKKQQIEKQAALSDLIRALAQQYRQSRLQVVLSQPNLDSSGRILAYFPFLKDAEAEQLARLKQALNQITLLNTQTAHARVENERLEQQKTNLDNASQSIKQKRLALLAQLSIEEQSQLDKTQPNAALEQLMMRVHKGRARLPLSENTILSRVYQPPVNGGAAIKQEQGMFFSSIAGSSISPIAPGQVIFADWIQGYGNLLLIDHGDNILSLYGHNEVLYAQPGQTVETNEVIARSGMSGGHLESGLYFELRHNGQPIHVSAWMQRTN